MTGIDLHKLLGCSVVGCVLSDKKMHLFVDGDDVRRFNEEIGKNWTSMAWIEGVVFHASDRAQSVDIVTSMSRIAARNDELEAIASDQQHLLDTTTDRLRTLEAAFAVLRDTVNDPEWGLVEASE